MSADRKALMRTASVAASLSLAALVPAAAVGAGLDTTARDNHAAAVAAVVETQLSPVPTMDDQKRSRALVEGLLVARQTGRNDVAGRSIKPINRRDAVVKGLETNLTLAIGRPDPDIAQTLVREARAVFDPVFDLSLGYNREASYLRQKLGTVIPKGVYTTVPTSAGGENIGGAVAPSDASPEGSTNYTDPLEANYGPLTGNRRLNTCKIPFNACIDNGTPQVRAIEFYQNSNTNPTQAEIVANNTINNGHPLQQVSVQLGVTQELPWGGSLQVTDQTIQQKIYYDSQHYWKDGEFTTNLTATLNTPVPFGKGFGNDNPDHAAIRGAEINRQQADWTLKDLNNQILESIDTAYFELVRQLEILASTVENRDLALRLKARQDRIIKQDPGLVTRYQEAQIKAEVSRAEIAVEAQLQTYLSASVTLAQLIGDPDAHTGAAIYLPYSYAHDLETPVAVTYDGAMTTAHINRPAFFIAKLGRDSADVGLKLAQNQARPDIQFSSTVALGENGSTYGYADPLQSQGNLIHPDTVNQNYALTYTYPWQNRAANAAVDIARLSVEDQEIVIRQTETQVRQEIATDLTAVQGARAELVHATEETRLLRSAYESLVRQLDAGLVGDDQIILALRNLISAEQTQIGARIDNREAETALLYAQGIIANALPGQIAVSALDRHRLTLLADAGYLKYFGAEKKK
jgi:outer membrane protein TolC